jgi:hypothetical protein
MIVTAHDPNPPLDILHVLQLHNKELIASLQLQNE